MRTIDATICSCDTLWMTPSSAKRHAASCPAGGHLRIVPIAYTLVESDTSYTAWAAAASAITTIDARSLIERVYTDRGDVFDRIVEGPFVDRLVWFFELFIIGGARCIAEYGDAYVIKTPDGIVNMPKCDATLVWLIRFIVKAYDTIVADASLPGSRINTVWSRTTRLPGLREHCTYTELVDVDVELPDEIRAFGDYIKSHAPRIDAYDAVDVVKVWTCPACLWSHPVRSKTTRHIKSCRHVAEPAESTEPIEPIERAARIVRIDPVDRPDRKRSREPSKIPIEYIEIDAVPTCDMTIADLVNCARPFAKSIELDGDAFLLTTRNQTTGGSRVERLDGFRVVQRVLTELERALCTAGNDIVETSRVVNDAFSKSRRFADGTAMTLFDFIDAETEPPGAASFVARTCRVLGESAGPR